MGKTKSFADKMNKATADYTKHCAECGESYSIVKLVSTEGCKVHFINCRYYRFNIFFSAAREKSLSAHS